MSKRHVQKNVAKHWNKIRIAKMTQYWRILEKLHRFLGDINQVGPNNHLAQTGIVYYNGRKPTTRHKIGSDEHKNKHF